MYKNVTSGYIYTSTHLPEGLKLRSLTIRNVDKVGEQLENSVGMYMTQELWKVLVVSYPMTQRVPSRD